MNIKDKLSNLFIKLTPEQKEGFLKYIPTKVYVTERNISIVVALIQLWMIIVFLVNRRLSVGNMRYLGYFCLYVTLLVATCIAIISYNYTVKNKKYKAFFWVRRVYALVLCGWVMGITYLELSGGRGLSSYYYLIPTTAAMLLLNPLESVVVFGGAWCGLAFIFFYLDVSSGSLFGNLMNSVFVTILSIFISYRYYKSSAVEYCDRELIKHQYEEIQGKNNLLIELVQRDQLTCLYNRHYLNEYLYSFFTEAQEKHYYGVFIMIDIDFFKQYNDLYGHLQGDDCLKIIANILNDECEEAGASAIRYGGEEFLIVKMSEEEFDAKILTDKFSEALKLAQLYRADVDPYYVTVSMGVWSNNLSNVANIEQAIQYADKALYEAKESGRNRAVFSGDNNL